MKINFKQLLFGAALFAALNATAGNEDRVGSAGASQLLVNPWARSRLLEMHPMQIAMVWRLPT